MQQDDQQIPAKLSLRAKIFLIILGIINLASCWGAGYLMFYLCQYGKSDADVWMVYYLLFVSGPHFLIWLVTGIAVVATRGPLFLRLIPFGISTFAYVVLGVEWVMLVNR